MASSDESMGDEVMDGEDGGRIGVGAEVSIIFCPFLLIIVL